MPTPVLLPWADENNTGSSNTKQRVRTIASTNVTAEADGAIRPEERINATEYTAADSKRHLLKKNIGATEFDSISMYTDMDNINVEDHNNTPSFNTEQNDIQPLQQDHDEKGLQPIQQQKNESLMPFKPNVDKPNLKRNIDFFDRVDKLRAYKEKHGHLNVREKEDQSLHGFCNNVRRARKGKASYRLDEGRIAALDAIGFNWNTGVKIGRVDELKPCRVTFNVNEHHCRQLDAEQELGTPNSTNNPESDSVSYFCTERKKSTATVTNIHDSVSGISTKRKKSTTTVINTCPSYSSDSCGRSDGTVSRGQAARLRSLIGRHHQLLLQQATLSLRAAHEVLGQVKYCQVQYKLELSESVDGSVGMLQELEEVIAARFMSSFY